MLKEINNYLNDNKFRFTVYDNSIHIINFTRLITLEEEYISFKTNNKKIEIYGNNLKLKKMIDNELLLSGTIIKIEVIHE